MLGAMEAGMSWPRRIVGGAAGGARPAGGTERHSCGQCPRPPRRGPATVARWGLISSFESRGGNRAAPGPPPSPEWRGRPQRRAHPGNRHHTGMGDTGRRDRGRDRGLEGQRDRGMQLPPSHAGRVKAHTCSSGLLLSPPEEEEEGRPSAPCTPGEAAAALSPPQRRGHPHWGQPA